MTDERFLFYNDIHKPKLVTAKQVQEEYLCTASLHFVRKFLKDFCSYRKIGRRYFYSREEVEQALLANENVEYIINENSKY